MDWTSRTPFQWDWETLALFSGEQTEISKPALLEPKSKIGSGIGMGNGSVYSFGGVAYPSSEVGNCSSRSSISASVDSSSKAIKRIPEINFESLELDNQNKNKDFARVDNSKTSAAVASAEGAKQSALGLKLGKRIYFEDPCVGNHTKSSSSSVSTNPSTTPVKKSRVYQQSMLSAYCQVEGCNMDLTTAKDYHRKHRVCENHSKSPKVVVAGQERRFCQQCSRFHALSEFDQKKRSCRRRLSDHNLRRRKPQLETISFNSSKLSTSYYDDKQQANFAFGQSPFSQMTTMASSIWDGSGCFKLTQTEGHWMKLSKTGGINGQLCFPSNDHSNNVPAVSHDMDRLFPPKGATAEVLNQGIEVTVAFNLDGAAPDHHRRALSLLSTDSHISDVPSADTNKTATNAAAYHAMRTINVRKGLWQQDEQSLAQVLPPFDSKSNGGGGGGGQFQESLPLKTSYSFGTGGFLDSSQLG